MNTKSITLADVASSIWNSDRTTKPGSETAAATRGTDRAPAPISIGPAAN